MNLKNFNKGIEKITETVLLGTLGLGMLAGISYLVNGVILRDYHINEILRNADSNQNYILEENELQELYRKANIPFDPRNSNPRKDLDTFNLITLPFKYIGGRK